MANENATDSADVGSGTAGIGSDTVNMIQCPRCEGTGVVESASGNNTVTCPRCKGSGEIQE